MSYRQTLEALKRRRDKRFIRGTYRRKIRGKTCFCAIGAVIPASREHGVDQIDDLWHGRLREQALAIDLRKDEALLLQGTNDTAGPKRETPAERYTRVVAWLEEQVAKEGGRP